MENITVFCDFDGTITKKDTVDHFLSVFADNKWLESEKLWKNGKIGSKECLIRQFACINYISENQLDNFTENIEIDDYFINFIEILNIFENLNQKKIKNEFKPSKPAKPSFGFFTPASQTNFYIVSDGFDFFINSTLKKYGIKKFVKVFSNKLNFNKGKLTLDFPFYNSNCKKKSGLCKCEIIKKLKKERRVLYIGDGASDICASGLADILFAKDSLAEYCDENNINHIKFETFKDICEYLYLNLGEKLDVKNEMLV
ncbi:MAG TPA: phosphoserine phosphatase [Cyanobacteria bacterium UBA9971]|nr:phosphoserine phosphatase [Cyanobacteria bacterium UBA9971]